MLFGAQIAVLAALASAAVVLVLTAVLGLDVGKELRRMTGLLAKERGLSSDSLTTSDANDVREEGLVLKATEAQFHILFAGFLALFISLTTCILLVVLSDQRDLAWRLAAAITLVAHTSGSFRLTRDTLRERNANLHRFLMIVIGWSISTIAALAAFDVLPSAATPIVFIGILWTLGVTSISFYALLAEMLRSR